MALPLRIACWFLTALALLAAAALVREAVLQWTRRPVAVRVASREMRMEVRDVPMRRSSRTMPWLFAVARLRLARVDGRGELTATAEATVSHDEAVTLRFLDATAPGTMHTARMVPGQPVEVDPPEAWQALGAFGLLTYLLGAFAWLACGGASDRQVWPAMGWRFAALGLLPFGMMAVALINLQLAKSREAELVRVPVEGRGHQVTAAQLMEELGKLGVQISGPERVRAFLEGSSLRYCEYQWQGQPWRSASLWCQPAEGEVCAGRVNPATARDVKWGYEP
ncbi:MAG: hypothetical protein IT162_05265 [Bryobacterales bacterium]|nr:hypothetical protein [Bryobacterales bacterium]